MKTIHFRSDKEDYNNQFVVSAMHGGQDNFTFFFSDLKGIEWELVAFIEKLKDANCAVVISYNERFLHDGDVQGKDTLQELHWLIGILVEVYDVNIEMDGYFLHRELAKKLFSITTNNTFVVTLKQCRTNLKASMETGCAELNQTLNNLGGVRTLYPNGE